MKLELTRAEHDLILHVLQSRLGELRQEIHHSTVSAYTDRLKEMEVLFKTLIGKLNSGGGDEGP